MPAWLIPPNEMEAEQLRAIELGVERHRVIVGPPGSGKTQILLHRAKYLCRILSIPNQRFRIFVYTNVLKEYIRSALDLLDLPQDCIIGLDAWCRAYYQRHIGTPPVVRHGRRTRPDFPAIRRGVLSHVRKQAAPSLYDFVLIDEGQDLDRDAWELLSLLGKHITVCLDNKQQIYERGLSEANIVAMLGLRKRNIQLLSAFRCSPDVVNLGAEFIVDKREKEEFIQQNRTDQSEKEKPVCFIAESYEKEREALFEFIRTRINAGERVAVLFPTRRQVYGYATGLREQGFTVETPPDLDFTSNAPKLMPYQSAKGLTFDSVFLPRLVNSSFRNVDEARIKHLLFVAITRATKWVYLSTVEGQEIRAIKELHDQDTCLEFKTGLPQMPDPGGSNGDESSILDDLW